MTLCKRYFLDKSVWILIILFLIIIFIYYSRLFLTYRPYWSWILEVYEFCNNFVGSLFLIPLLYAAIVFWWRGLAIALALALFLAIPLFIRYYISGMLLFVNILYLCIPLIIVGYIHMELNWRKRERRVSLEREMERQQFMSKVFEAHENERKIIAQELHDDVIQSMLLNLKTINEIFDEARHNGYTDIQEQAQSVMKDIRIIVGNLKTLSVNLRPSILDNLGFLPALKWLVGRFNEDNNINVKIVVLGEKRDLPRGSDVIAFRIVQEALNNIRRHANATDVILTIQFRSETISISVIDNGRGFQVPENITELILQEKLGLLGIQERVRFLNGILNIRSEPGKGTSISVDFKLSPSGEMGHLKV